MKRKIAGVHSKMRLKLARNARLAAAIAAPLAALMAPGGIIVADQDLGAAAGTRMALPDAVPAGRYFLFRAGRTRAE